MKRPVGRPPKYPKIFTSTKVENSAYSFSGFGKNLNELTDDNLV